MKKIAVVILTVLTCIYAKAQEIPLDIVDRVNAVDYIFEGEVINSQAYFTNSGAYIHTSNTVAIKKILKGAINCGTIEIITLGGQTDSSQVQVSHSLTLSVGSIGIFLCTDTDIPVSVVDFYPETNTQKLEATYEDQSFMRYWWDGEGVNAADIWNNFDSLYAVYNSMEAITGISLIDCEGTGGAIHGVPPHDPNDDNVIFPHYRQADFDSLMAYAEFQRRHYTRTNDDRDEHKIFYNIEDLIITGTSTKYLEFDVTAKDDYGLGYLDISGVRLKYDPAVFGSNVVANANIIVTRGTLNADPACYADPIPSDDNSYTVLIPAFETEYSSCKAPILTTPQCIMHVKMEILDCTIPSDIILQDTATFFGPSLMVNYSAFSDFPADTFSTYYEFIEHSQVEAVPACVPTITDFSPTIVAGGIEQILNIRGFQFGATRGNGAIFMKNADDGGTSEVFLNNGDFVLWSDTLIQIKVPSYDTAIVGGFAQTGQAAGSGLFEVFTNDGSSVVSPSPLTIKYSVDNHPSKNPYLLTPRNEFSQAFVFHCDTALANYKGGAMKAVIDKALRDWTCLTGINWYLGADTAYTHSSVLNDTLCILKLGNLGGGSVYAKTSAYKAICADYVHFETDIVIDTTFDWFCDTLGSPVPLGQQNIYSTILHELGHAHGLKHVMGSSNLMYYAIAPGSIGVINLVGDHSCDAGGNWIMDFSTDPSNITTCGVTSNILQLPNPCSTVAIYELENNQFSYTVYPNPVSNKLTVEFHSVDNNQLNLSLIDIRGRSVLSQTEEVQEGENIIDVAIDFLPKGMYILVLRSTNDKINIKAKIIKHEN